MDILPITDIILQGKTKFYRIAWDETTALSLSAKGGIMALAHAGVSYTPAPSNSDALPVPVPTPPPTPVSHVIPSLTGFTYQSYGPILMPFMAEATRPDAVQRAIGEVIAQGGVGPYKCEFVTNPGGYRFASWSSRGFIVTPYNPVAAGGSDKVTVKVTDATGASVTGDIIIDKSAANPTIYPSPLSFPANMAAGSIYANLNGAFGIGHSYSDTLSVQSDPSGLFSATAAVLQPKSVPSVGVHSVTLAAASATGAGTITQAFSIEITPGEITGPIYWTPRTISTSTLAGFVLGRAYCSTPTNSGSWSIDAGGLGALSILGTGDVLLNTPVTAPPGDYKVRLTRTDGTASFTQEFPVTVFAGVTLDESNIKVDIRQDFTNYFPLSNTTERPVSAAPPKLTGFPDSSKVRWYVSALQRWNVYMDTPGTVESRGGWLGDGWQRFYCDPIIGQPYVKATLSDTTGTPGEWFDLTASDGIHTCTKRCFVQVKPVIGPVYYVGPNAGPPASVYNGAFTKKGTIADVVGMFCAWDNRFVGAQAGATLYVEYDPSNPDRYVQDMPGYDSLRMGINGPLKVIFLKGPKGERVYHGGARDTVRYLPSDKGLWIINHGDFSIEGGELARVFAGDFAGDYVVASNYTQALIRQNSGVSGDIRVYDMVLHDADLCLESGNSDGYWAVTNTHLYNGSGATSTGGAAQHTAYEGHIRGITVTDVLSENVADGHMFKCRAAEGTWTRYRGLDGTRGSSYNALDLPSGGKHTLNDCVLHKGAMSQNPFILQYGEENLYGDGSYRPDEGLATQTYEDDLVCNNVTFINHGTEGIIFAAAVMHAGYRPTLTGRFSTVTLNDCKFAGMTAAEMTASNYGWAYGGHDFTPVNNRPTLLTDYPPLDRTSPVIGGWSQRPGWHTTLAWLNNRADFPYYSGRQIDPGVDEIRIPANAPPGTVILPAMRAYNTPNYARGTPPDVNPFVAGTTWGDGTVPKFHTGASFNWANLVNPGRYTFVANPDGTGQLVVGPKGLGAPGRDNVLIRAVAPSGRPVENAFPVIKT